MDIFPLSRSTIAARIKRLRDAGQLNFWKPSSKKSQTAKKIPEMDTATPMASDLGTGQIVPENMSYYNELLVKYGKKFAVSCNHTTLKGLFLGMFEKMIERKSMAIIPRDAMYGPFTAAYDLLVSSGFMARIDAAIDIMATEHVSDIANSGVPFSALAETICEISYDFFHVGHVLHDKIEMRILRFFAMLAAYRTVGRWFGCDYTEIAVLINFANGNGLLDKEESDILREKFSEIDPRFVSQSVIISDKTTK